MLRLTDDIRSWLLQRIPDTPISPRGGRPPLDKSRALGGIFWILDNGAKWKDLPREFGAKSAVHRHVQRWVREGVFERILRDAGRVVEARGGYRLYECFIDGTFSKARGDGDGVGPTKAGKGVKIMILVDAKGLPVAIETLSASPHESQLVQRLFDFMLTEETPDRVIGDKAYDSDTLATHWRHTGGGPECPGHGADCTPSLESQERHPRRAVPAKVQAPLDG